MFSKNTGLKVAFEILKLNQIKTDCSRFFPSLASKKRTRRNSALTISCRLSQQHQSLLNTLSLSLFLLLFLSYCYRLVCDCLRQDCDFLCLHNIKATFDSNFNKAKFKLTANCDGAGQMSATQVFC